ncbi:hypothetical protein ACWCPQ_23290 [Nocardia sp. NPDC001965]
MDTAHTISEPNVVIDGDRAQLRAMVEVRHRLVADRRRYADLTYLCTAQLIGTESRWLLRYIGIDTVRHEGNPTEIYCRAPVGARPRLRSG